MSTMEIISAVCGFLAMFISGISIGMNICMSHYQKTINEYQDLTDRLLGMLKHE